MPGSRPRRPMKTEMPSSLEIAQQAELRPITEVAADAGSPPGGDRAVRPLQGEGRPVRDRAPRRPAGREARQRHGDNADASGRGEDDDVGLAHAGPRRARPEAGALPARGLARAGLRGEGRRGWRRLRAGRADGGPEPPLHGRPARDHGGEQPPLRADRRPPPPRQRDGTRSARDLLAPLHGHERPQPAERRHRPGRKSARRAARDRVRHHRRERDHGARRRRSRSAGPSGTARPDHRRPDLRGRAGDRRADRGCRCDGGRPQGRRSSPISCRRSRVSRRSSIAVRSRTSRTATTRSSPIASR